MLTDYDRRQLDIVNKYLLYFEINKIELYELCAKLTGLLNALESVDENWQGLFRKELNGLEQIYDVEQEGFILSYNKGHQNECHELIATLRRLVKSKLEEYLNYSDPTISKKAIPIDNQWFFCPECTDSWECTSTKAMIICPKCNQAFHNPYCKGIENEATL